MSAGGKVWGAAASKQPVVDLRSVMLELELERGDTESIVSSSVSDTTLTATVVLPPPLPALPQEEADMQLAMTLQAIEDEESILAQELFARRVEAAKRSGTEKLRVVARDGDGELESPGPTHSTNLAFTRSVEKAEQYLEKRSR